MEYIRVTKDNIDIEHICCALSNNKHNKLTLHARLMRCFMTENGSAMNNKMKRNF